MKILKKISKKIVALLLSISLLFSNLMPLTTVFALTETEKEDLVELRMRGSVGIDINDGQATIHYDGGDVTVSGADLHHEQDDHLIHILYTSSTSLTFHFYPDEDRGVSYRVGGDNPERPENNEWTFSNIELRRQRMEGYDLEFQFPDDNSGGNGGNGGEFQRPEPNGTFYEVNFGTASWEVNGVTVTASVQGLELANEGFVNIRDGETIHLANYDPNTMEVRVSATGGFSSRLDVDEDNLDYTTCVAWTIDGVLPFNEDLNFVVQPKPQNQEGVYNVEFGEAEWNIDGEYVTATLEDNNMVLTNGPVDIGAHDAIHLEGFNHETMIAVVEDHHGFRAELWVDESNNTSIDAVGPDQHVPNENTLFFFIDHAGEQEPGNPYQEGNTTAIIRVNGFDGEYTETFIDPETGEEREETRPYNGRGAVCNETKFNINDGKIWGLLPEGEVENGDGWFQYNEIEYSYDEKEGDTTIKLGLFTQWHQKFSDKIVINNDKEHPYYVSDYIDYDDAGDWLEHQRDGYVGFYLTIPKTEDNIYYVMVQIDPNPVEYVSEFRWTNDPADMFQIGPNGELTEEVNPAYFEHVKLELVNVHFSVGLQEYNYNETTFKVSSFDNDFIAYRSSRHQEYTMGELYVPSNTTVTVRLTPDPGYQVSSLLVPGDFETSENPGEYTFTLPNHFEDVVIIVEESDDAIINNHPDVADLAITLPSSVVIDGNYEFVISEADLSNDEKAAFQEYADNYTISSYFNLRLSQVLSIADSVDAWMIPINTINKKGTVSITLGNAITGDDFIVIRDTGNGFERITPTVNNNVISFETKKFGDFAIAGITLIEIESIDITVAPPTPGQKVNVRMEHDPVTNEDYPVADVMPVVTVSDGANYFVDSAAWVNGTCHGGAGACNELFNGTFDGNNDYHAMISVTANEGYKITVNTLDHITVNGRALDTGGEDETFNVYDNGGNTMFVALISQNTTPVMKGDMNGNGRIDLADIITLLKKYLSDDFTDEEKLTGDMNDNKRIDLADIIALLKAYLVG